MMRTETRSKTKSTHAAPAHAGGVHCPTCGSDECKSFEMVHVSGLSDTASTTTGLDVGIAGSVDTVGTITTRLASRAAPPEPKSMILIYVMAVWLGGVPVMALALGDFSVFVLGAIILSPVVYFWKRTHRWNTTVYPKLLKEWRRRWMCLSCGAAFDPSLDGRGKAE